MAIRQLRIIRKQNKLSQQQLADVLGISRSAYCSYETGRRTPDFETLVRLGRFYNLSIDVFAEENEYEIILSENENYEGPGDTRYLSQLSKEERDLIVNLRRLNSDEKKQFEDLVNKKANNL